jgi:hypothetical protein
LTTRIETMQPYATFAASFFRTASDPDSPASPFSEASAPARAMAIAVYDEVVAGSDLKLPAEMRARLPELLWLVQMAIVLFWVHDRSRGSRRTFLLIDRAVPLIDNLIGLTRYRLLRPVVTDAFALLDELSERGP